MALIKAGRGVRRPFIEKRIRNYLFDLGAYALRNRLDVEPTAFLLDDFAITLNETRYQSNLAIGLALQIRGNPVYPLEAMVNCCGMVVAKLQADFTPRELIKKLSRFEDRNLDFARKNHFISVYGDGEGEFYAVLHTSFPQVKTGHHEMPGLYPHEDGHFSKAGDEFVGQFGRYTFLADDVAIEYENAVAYWDEYSRLRREEVAQELFDRCTVLFSRSHVTVPRSGLTLLGAYYSPDPEEVLVLTEGPGKEAHLFNVRDFDYVCALEGYLLAHGSGIDFDCDDLELVLGRIVVRKGDGMIVVDKLTDLPFTYNSFPRLARRRLSPVVECKITL